MYKMKIYCFLILYLLQEVHTTLPVQNSTFVIQTSDTVDIQVAETYQWKTGSWTACNAHKKCGEGQRIRRIWCINSAGFIVHNSNCLSSTRPSTVKQCFSVCDHQKFDLRWRTSDWSPCTVQTINQHSAESISGIANRTVECVLISANIVVENEACEYFWDKPESEMACSVDPPNPCVVAKTNITCRVRECSKIITWMEEVDDVIVAPTMDSAKCSGLISRLVCKKHPLNKCKSLKGKKLYKIKISSWSPCISSNISWNAAVFGNYLQISSHPILGYSKRNISCIDEDGNETNMSFCSQSTLPPLLRQCVVSVDCKVSPWSEWHVDIEGCVATDGSVFPETRVRQRKLLQLPVGIDAKPCPPLYEKRIITTDLRPCYKHQWYPLEWSDCQILLHGNHGEVTVLKPTCSNGLQYRNLTCLRMRDMVPVDESLCKNPRPSTVRRCKIPCQRDCRVSHWSKWGPCMNFNMSNLREFSENGYRRRIRSVVVNPANGGQPCPDLEEVRPCQFIDFFGWHYGPWSQCATVKENEKCGAGRQSRDITCLKWNGARMNDYWCDIHWPQEDTRIPCRVPCPNDCIMREWSTWSQCPPECSHPGPKYPRFYFNRTVLAIAGEGGRACRRIRKEDMDCKIGYCLVYKWTTSKWGRCFLPNNSDDASNRPCGTGIQKRKVTCLVNMKKKGSKEFCDFMKKPESERECQIPCPVDCVVTNFSDWTLCNESCDSDSVQYRHRIILQSSRYGGKPCPEALVEARPCSSSMNTNCLRDSSINPSRTYSWHVGNWSDCRLPFDNQTCGMGFQVRNVSCKNGFHIDVEPHFCLPSNWTLPDGPIMGVPSRIRSCEVFCSSNCVVSAWSAWSECYYSYDVKRSRHRELVGSRESSVGNESAEECLKKIDLLEQSNCPMIPTNLTDPASDLWMSCIVERENQTEITRNGQRVLHDCGRGYRYKFGIQLSSAKGVEPGLERDMCFVDCPIDCHMSSWSDWTECNVPCGQGFRERKRHILVEGNELGRPCPKTVNQTEVQRDVCNIVCMDYNWVAAGWSDCYLDNVIGMWNNSECGTGTHYQEVKCFDKRIEKEVPDYRCDPQTKPPTVESCRIFCPGECVVSEWSISKKCTEPCKSENFQELTRNVFREPNSTAEPCPPLIEREPCVLNATCHHHDWILGPWGSCVVPEGAYCGEGVQKRPLICLRSDGRQVDPIQCEKTHKSLSLEQPLSKPCYIDCPVDCVMSQWSPWDKSSCKACGTIGVMTRKRHILQPPSDAGQPCPVEFEQKKPCEFKPCYHWKHYEWSQCDLEGASCGYGVRRRVVECIRFDHLKVDKAHCLVVNITFDVNSWIDSAWLIAAQQDSREEELCHVPCPGDCVMSEWSSWSHCQKNCKIGQQVGYQTSSRHILFRGTQSSQPCSKQLWRTKPCWSDECDIFAWKLRNSSYICERKDGLEVRGGCSLETRPCFPACKQLGGFCENGTCYCENDNGEKIIMGPTSNKCSKKGPRPPANHSAPTPEIKLKYYPDDSKVSFWMYAMISVGTAFIIFVAVTVYLMCRSSLRQRTVSVERQPSVRRRLTGAINDQSKATLESSPDVRSKHNKCNETYFAS